MLFSTDPTFDAEAAFTERLSRPDTPAAWRAEVGDSLSPLHTWVRAFGDTDDEVAMVQTLVDEGLDAGDVRDVDGVSLLHIAAQSDRHRLLPVLVSGMLAQGQHGIDLTAGTWDQTPLLGAALMGAARSATTLVGLGASVTVADNNRNTPLHHLVRRWKAPAPGEPEAVQVLIDAGASLNAKNKFGNTPLHDAAMAGHVEPIRRLIAAGANVDLINRERQTALQVAEEFGHADAAGLLRQVLIDREARTLRRAMGRRAGTDSPPAPVRRRM